MADMIATDDQRALLMADLGLTEPVATLLLELATGEVQAMAGQRLVLVDDDPFELYGSTEQWFVLPERPVVDLSEITIDDGDPLVAGTDFKRAGKSARLWRFCGWAHCSWEPSIVAGVYSHGYALDDQRLVPAQDAVLGLARQAGANPSAVESESIDDYRVQFASALAVAAASAEYLRDHLQRTYGTRAGLVRVFA